MGHWLHFWPITSSLPRAGPIPIRTPTGGTSLSVARARPAVLPHARVSSLTGSWAHLSAPLPRTVSTRASGTMAPWAYSPVVVSTPMSGGSRRLDPPTTACREWLARRRRNLHAHLADDHAGLNIGSWGQLSHLSWTFRRHSTALFTIQAIARLKDSPTTQDHRPSPSTILRSALGVQVVASGVAKGGAVAMRDQCKQNCSP
jgi:hypothetical protein